jgi:cell division protein FtsB
MNEFILQIIVGVFMALLSLLGAVGVWIAKSVDKMRDSVAELNAKIGIIVTQQTNDRRTIDDHGHRISKLEEES